MFTETATSFGQVKKNKKERKKERKERKGKEKRTVFHRTSFQRVIVTICLGKYHISFSFI